VIRRVRDEDAEELFALTVNNRSYLREWLPWLDHVKTVNDTHDFISHVLSSQEAGEVIVYMIRDSNKIVGVCGFNKIDHNEKAVYIGYWLAESSQGKGLITQACKELEKIAFEDLGATTTIIRVAEMNLKSRAVAERLGYRETGIIKDAEWLYDHYVNFIVYEKKI